MAALERVMQLREQGLSDSDIIGTLRQEGVSPKEIQESLSQASIKMSIDSSQNQQGEVYQDANYGVSGMQESPYQEQDTSYTPDYSQEAGYGQEMYPGGEQQMQVEGVYPEYYPQEDGGYPEYQPQGSLDVESITEICEQTIEEKTESMRKELSSLKNFKEELSFQVQNMNERLTKIEENIESLQSSIIRKVGIYGEDIKNLAKEMSSTQESFSKILDPLTDNIRELQRITGQNKIQEMIKTPLPKNPQAEEHEEKNEEKEEKSDKDERKVTKKQTPNFEDYLR